MGNENQSMAMLNTYGQSRTNISLSSKSFKYLNQAPEVILQVQLDMVTKANGYGWRESQDKPKID